MLRAAGLVGLAALAACSTVMVVGEQHRASPRTRIVRVAEERGISDALSTRRARLDPSRGPSSPATPVRIEVPVEIHARADSVILTGCALQPFRVRAFSGPDFPRDSVTSDPDLSLVVPTGVDPVVRPGEHRLVTIHLTKGSSDPDVEAFGLRIDERASILDSIGPCPPVTSTGDSIQHYGFRRVEVEPLGPAVAAGVMALFTLVVVGR